MSLGVVNRSRSRVQRHDVDQNGEQDYGVVLSFADDLYRSFLFKIKRDTHVQGRVFRRGIPTSRLEHTYTWEGTDYGNLTIEEMEGRLYNSEINGDNVHVHFGLVQSEGEFVAHDVNFNDDLLFVTKEAFDVVARDKAHDIAELGEITRNLTDDEVISTVAARIGATLEPQPSAPRAGRSIGGNAGTAGPMRLLYNDMVKNL